MAKEKTMTIRLTQELFDQATEKAQQVGLTASEWVRSVVTERLVHRVRFVEDAARAEEILSE